MRIEEAEEIIGRRWQYWTDQEILEFVQAMEPSDLVYPLYLDWAVKHYGELSRVSRDHLARLGCLEPRGAN